MAETLKPAPKRRRILDPSAIVSVPIYSNQVSNSLQMSAPVFSEGKSAAEEAEADDGFWSKFSRQTKTPKSVSFSDSEDEAEPVRTEPLNDTDPLRSPSPPPDSPVQKPSRKAKQKLDEIERGLLALNSMLSPVDHSSRLRNRRSPRLRGKTGANEVIFLTEDDKLITSSSEPSPLPSPVRGPERQIPLKVRCRTDLHKITVRPSTPLSDVVEQLSVKLGVPPPRLLLLREEAELSRDSTVEALGLGIADILECVVMAQAEQDTPTVADANDVIKLRLQGKNRAMAQEVSLRRDAPLGSVFTQYSSGLSIVAQSNVCFHFDGCKLAPHQTPKQLDMEDGDIIEVWA
ncbi:NFATC2-interacting protein [Eucyclogobius newberryi]|uniref:NFATC2-interacting protein n=1 Tax=Eucyclogobius newberryi TaxID=166745 RepID=UPI003B591D94